MTTKPLTLLAGALLSATVISESRAAVVTARASATAMVCVVVAPVSAADMTGRANTMSFRQVNKLSDGFHILMSAPQGQRFTIQASSNLGDWVDVGTVEATNGVIGFVDRDVAERQRFYRARRLP